MSSHFLSIILQGNEAIRYLEFCVQMLNNTDQAIHNYLLSLYGKLQPDHLLTYLNLQGQVTIFIIHMYVWSFIMK